MSLAGSRRLISFSLVQNGQQAPCLLMHLFGPGNVWSVARALRYTGHLGGTWQARPSGFKTAGYVLFLRLGTRVWWVLSGSQQEQQHVGGSKSEDTPFNELLGRTCLGSGLCPWRWFASAERRWLWPYSSLAVCGSAKVFPEATATFWTSLYFDIRLFLLFLFGLDMTL